MRRMTNEEMAYYAAKQRTADKKAKARYNFTMTIIGIILFAIITILAGIGAGAENNAFCVWAMIAIIPVMMYFVHKICKGE